MSEFTDYLAEVFAGLGTITARRLFGGHGIYHDGLMFGLVVDDQLYLKADAQSQPLFHARGLAPFAYLKQGRPVNLSYWQAPAEIFDDPDEARDWARLAFDAALRRRGVA